MTRNLSPLLPLGALLAAALAAGCTPGATTPPTDPSTQTPAFNAADMSPGTHVQVARQGQWYAAVIVQPLGEGRFLVHYDNTGNEWNEAVGPDRIKPLPGASGPARDYRPGEKVLVTYQGRLLLGEVVSQTGADTWRVHYDGFGAEAAENVSFDRMRRPFPGPSGHTVGESLAVDVNGTVLPAKVLAISAADRWLVRFDNFGPQYDQEVGVDRIRAAATVAPPPAPPPAVAPPTPPPAEPPAPPKPEKAAEKPAEKAKPKPAAAPDAPAVPSGPPAVGEEVLVAVRGAWVPASVSAVAASGMKVKFASGGEEEVPPERVVRSPGSLKGLHFQPGQLVLVEFKGIFVPGKVIKVEGKSDLRVRFEGQGPEGDEIVPARRLRPR